MLEILVETLRNSIPRVSDLTPFEGTVFDYPLLYGITGSRAREAPGGMTWTKLGNLLAGR